LSDETMPDHSHDFVAQAAPGTVASPAGAQWAEPGVGRAEVPTYSNVTASPLQLSEGTLTATGGGEPHENEPPLLVFTICIAYQGVFPARS
ncbi:MAG: phage tail protein, partial [Acidimicrobiales bacterium]